MPKTIARFLLCFTLLLCIAFPVSAAEITRQSISSEGRDRTYYTFVPDNVKAPAPLIVMLHGSGRDGRLLLEKWRDCASKEGIVLVGPDASDRAGWTTPVDGPEFLFNLVESLKKRYPIDPQRVYLFGHSAGAVFGLIMALDESEYFAAAAVSAGALLPQQYSIIDSADRKIPIFIQVGTRDEFFPMEFVRATRDVLKKRGFPIELKEIPDHNHNYYAIADQINQDAWNFLKEHQLSNAPKYVHYEFK